MLKRFGGPSGDGDAFAHNGVESVHTNPWFNPNLSSDPAKKS